MSPVTAQTISLPIAPLMHTPQTQSLPSSPRLGTDATLSRPSRLGTKPVPSSSFDKSAFPTTQPMRISSPPLQPRPLSSYTLSSAIAPQKPNYNISLSEVLGAPSKPVSSPTSYTSPNYTPPTTIMPLHAVSSPPSQAMPLPVTSMLTPMQPTRVVVAKKPVTKDDWGDFDPLK